MRRTTTMRTGLSALLIVGAWATFAAGPASAAGAPEPTRTSGAPASAGLLDAMQRDFGLTKTQA
ncbi:S1 family peptidase, partial [Streptomyces umbrinus]